MRGTDKEILNIGRNINNTFSVISVLAKGRKLVFHVHVPSDCEQHEVKVDVSDARELLQHRPDLLRRSGRRVDICRELAGMLVFFKKDGRRLRRRPSLTSAGGCAEQKEGRRLRSAASTPEQCRVRPLESARLLVSL